MTSEANQSEHPLLLGKEWGSRAEANIEKWGNQPPKMLILAMAEELAEIVDEVFPHEARPPVAYDHEYQSILNDIRTTGFAARECLERCCEGADGDPLPDEEWPGMGGVENPEAALTETKDLAPLCWQLYWALDTHHEVSAEGGSDE